MFWITETMVNTITSVLVQCYAVLHVVKNECRPECLTGLSLGNVTPIYLVSVQYASVVVSISITHIYSVMITLRAASTG